MTQTAHQLGHREVRTRSVEGVYKSPGLHWVGDGFRVAGYFSTIPDAMRKLDPFLLLDYHPAYDYSPSAQPRGVGVHPHRGFETVTLAFQGRVAHHDSTGAGGVIGPGDVQWMTAASGILHKEYHEAEWSRQGGTFQMAQLWVNLPRAHKMDRPRYQGIVAGDIPEVALPEDVGRVRVIAGEFMGSKGPAMTHSPMSVLDVHLTAGGRISLDFPTHFSIGLLIMEGELKVSSSQRVTKHDFVVFKNDGEHFTLQANTTAQILVLAGEPIREPIVSYGPFVMNDRSEILQAFQDFNSGKFGHLED